MFSVRQTLLGGVAKVAATYGRQDMRDYGAEQKARSEQIRQTGVEAPAQDVTPVGKSVRTTRKGAGDPSAAFNQQATAVKAGGPSQPKPPATAAVQPQAVQATQGRAAVQPQAVQATQGRAAVQPQAVARPADVTVRSGQGYGSTGAKITGGKGIASGMVDGQTSLATSLMRAQVGNARGGNSTLHAGMKFNDFAGIPIYAGMTKSTPSGVKKPATQAAPTPSVRPTPAPAVTASTSPGRGYMQPSPGGPAPVATPAISPVARGGLGVMAGVRSSTSSVSTPTAPRPVINQPGAKPPTLAVPVGPRTPSATAQGPIR